MESVHKNASNLSLFSTFLPLPLFRYGREVGIKVSPLVLRPFSFRGAFQGQANLFQFLISALSGGGVPLSWQKVFFFFPRFPPPEESFSPYEAELASDYKKLWELDPLGSMV